MALHGHTPAQRKRIRSAAKKPAVKKVKVTKTKKR